MFEEKNQTNNSPSASNSGVFASGQIVKNIPQKTKLSDKATESGVGSGPTPIRTFQSDVAGILKGGSGSLAKIAIAEQEKKEVTGVYDDVGTNDEPKYSRFIMIVSTALVALGLLVFGTFFVISRFKKPPVNPIIPAPLIASDSEMEFSVDGKDRDKIISALVKEREKNTSKLSSIETVRFVKGAEPNYANLSTYEFLDKLESKSPSELVRTLDNDFIFGFHSLNHKVPFLVLRTNYYQNGFAGMLEWEKNIVDDLGPIFIKNQSQPIATTTADILSRKDDFEDAVIKNRDTRVLRRSDGTIYLIYSFADKKNIIITTNADTLSEVAGKIFATSLVQ